MKSISNIKKQISTIYIRNIKIFSYLVCIFAFFFLVFGLSSCAAMRKKFTRKPKKDQEKKEEVIYVPEEYPESILSVEQTYLMHFTFWEHWHKEFLQRFEVGGNKKKWLSCIDEEIKNLQLMRDIIALEEKQTVLDNFIQVLNDLREELDDSAVFGASDIYHRKIKMEQIARDIHRELAYSKVKQHLIQSFAEQEEVSVE